MENTILVVDDNPVNRKILMNILGKEGYHPVEAVDGEQALSLAHEIDPDVILLDVMMPGRDGYSVCRELKQDAGLEDVPVLFLSALSELKDKVEGFDAGGNDYITKPYQQGEVLARVRRSLSLRRRDLRGKQRVAATVKNEQRLSSEMDSARQLQEEQLPSRTAVDGSLEVAYKRVAPDGVSPEQFSAFRLDASHAAFYLYDVGGTGLARSVSALALGSLINHRPGGLLRPKPGISNSSVIATPGQVLESLDKAMSFKEIDPCFNLHYLVLDTAESVLRFAGVGGPDVLLLRKNGKSEWLRGSLPSSDMGYSQSYRQGVVDIAKGDRIYLFSDGYSLAMGRDHRPFGEGRVEAMLQALRSRSLEDAIDGLDSAVAGHILDQAALEPRSIMGLEYQGAH